ncbi:MAG: serine hydrolase [Solirubrobacterales bacterium]
MNRRIRATGTLIAVLTCALGFASSAQAETQAPPSLLPFDPIALEFVLPGNTVRVDSSNVRALSTQTKPIGKLTYSWAGKTKSVDQYLAESSTDSFLVLDDGVIAYERYFDINTRLSRHQSWSMAKSFLSTLIGIAVSEGKIDSIDDPVTKYVPSLSVNG